MVELTDSVVSAAQRGDRDALAAIWRALAPSVQGYLHAKGVRDPEGVTSDVFLALLPRMGRVTGGASGLRKLVFTIAHARMVDEHRSRSRAPSVINYEPAADTRTVRSAEDDAEAGLAMARVLAVLDELLDDQREVLILRVVADLTIEQIAAVIGRTPGAVKQLQRRGMVTVRRMLAERQVTL
jgi:RNA polymerase sigma-70 factor (ECF subfamily)